MNPILKKCQWVFFLIIFIFITIPILSPNAYAIEKMSTGRIIWDNIMLWINFGILVFLFLKYAKKPLMGFLRGESDKIEEDLNDVETQLKKAKSIMDSEVVNLKDLEGRIQEIRENIIEFTQREIEKTIEKAKITANQMIEGVNKESKYKLEMAKKAIEAEMMDIAISIVEGKLKKGLKPEDDEKLINQFLSGMDTAKKFFN